MRLTQSDGKPHLALIWLAWTYPVVDAPLIDALIVPRYGYEPSNVQRAFRTGDA